MKKILLSSLGNICLLLSLPFLLFFYTVSTLAFFAANFSVAKKFFSKAATHKKVTVAVHNQSPFNLPTYQTVGSSGMDIQAWISKDVYIYDAQRNKRLAAIENDSITLQPNETALIPTGLRFIIPEGYELQIRNRSSVGLKTGLDLPNGIGTIDSDYTDEVKLILHNHKSVPIRIKNGERMSQLVLAKVERIELRDITSQVNNLSDICSMIDETELAVEQIKRKGGFGSTGK